MVKVFLEVNSGREIAENSHFASMAFLVQSLEHTYLKTEQTHKQTKKQKRVPLYFTGLGYSEQLREFTSEIHFNCHFFFPKGQFGLCNNDELWRM